jgi:parvulin-like peptidyl-prolyl isomerase
MIRNLAFLLSPLLFGALPAFSQAVEVNGIAAKVNGSVITKNEVAFMLSPIYSQLVTQFPRRGPEFEKQFNEAREKILQELIDRRIILDEFKQIGASIRSNLIDEEVKRQIRELYNGNESLFREELKKSRMTMDGYREMTREKMVVQAMRAQQFSDAPPPLPNEIQNEYDEVKNYHINYLLEEVKPQIVKIDIEGAEYSIIEQVLNYRPEVLFIELHGNDDRSKSVVQRLQELYPNGKVSDIIIFQKVGGYDCLFYK